MMISSSQDKPEKIAFDSPTLIAAGISSFPFHRPLWCETVCNRILELPNRGVGTASCAFLGSNFAGGSESTVLRKRGVFTTCPHFATCGESIGS